MTKVIQNSNTQTVPKGVNVAKASFLSRFLPSPDISKSAIPTPIVTPETLDPIERQRLMEACLAECRASGASLIVDWPEVDRINDRIRETKTRSELVLLLAQYKAVLCGGQKI